MFGEKKIIVPEEIDPFYCLGALRLFEAKAMVRRLEETDIRFEIEDVLSNTDQLLEAMPRFGSGTLSDGPMVNIFIHRDDEKKFRKISGEFLKI